MQVKTRYSDHELQEFKDLLLGKLKTEKEVLKDLSSSLDSTNDSNEERDGSPLHLEKEGLNTLISRSKKFIEQLEFALMRITNKTYGICSETNKLIPKERLRAAPTTTKSMEAKLKQEHTPVRDARAA